MRLQTGNMLTTKEMNTMNAKILFFLSIMLVFVGCTKSNDSPDNDQEQTTLFTIIVNTSKESHFYIDEPNEGKKTYTKENVDPTFGNVRLTRSYKIGTTVKITSNRDDNEDVNLIVGFANQPSTLCNITKSKEVSYTFTVTSAGIK